MKQLQCNTILVIVSAILLGTPVTAQVKNAFQYEIQKSVQATKGAVVSAHPLASHAGISVLKKGGNAMDAAIATQLALAVVYPGAGNIGGGGFLVAQMNGGKRIALDYREKAPSKASRDMYLDSTGKPRFELSQSGHLASGVPGTVAGLFAAHAYAKLPFKDLIQPAIELAEKGFVITQHEADGLNSTKTAFLKNNTRPTAFVKEKPWKAGDTLVQSELAGTLKRIRDNGVKGFYEGETAKLIVEEMQRGGGLITREDLRQYKAVAREPMAFPYKDFTIISMPLPSSGGIIIQQMLKMVQKRDLSSLGFQTPASVQLIVEAERRAYADRAEFMGDPDFVKVPVKTIVSDSYIQQRMADYRQDTAGSSAVTKAGVVPHESEQTTHLSVADRWGNVVSVTTTLNGGYGSRTVVGGAGFLMNNEMDDFSVKPGVPNMYGAIGNEANAIAPGKRMLSSMTPTIVLKEGKPFFVVGTPGGTTIPTSVFQALVNVIDFNMGTEKAINSAKFHHQWLPDEIMVEPDFPETVREALRKMGYKITVRGFIGRTEAILLKPDRKGGFTLDAVGDKRGDDHAEGY